MGIKPFQNCFGLLAAGRMATRDIRVTRVITNDDTAGLCAVPQAILRDQSHISATLIGK